MLTCDLVKNVLCFLFSYYELSFVIFLNLMIRGRLLDIPCKQPISKHYFFKKLEIIRFQIFKSLCHFLKMQTFTFNYVVQLKILTTFPFPVFLSHSMDKLDWN